MIEIGSLDGLSFNTIRSVRELDYRRSFDQKIPHHRTHYVEGRLNSIQKGRKMSNVVVLCEACPKEIPQSEALTILTRRGKMILCPECSKKPENEDTSPKTPEVKYTEADLFKQFLMDEQLKIKDIDLNTQEGQQILISRFRQLESIAFEAKTRATVVAKSLREIESKGGAANWNKTRGKEDKSNLADPAAAEVFKKEKAKHKADLTKVEKMVKGYLELGYNDAEILDMFPVGGKIKGHEVREAISKFNKGD